MPVSVTIRMITAQNKNKLGASAEFFLYSFVLFLKDSFKNCNCINEFWKKEPKKEN